MTPLQITTVVIFIIAMVIIASEKVHRALVAMVGAVVLLLFGIMPFDAAMDAIDFNTLGVLVGMMMFVGVVKQSGLFEFLAIKAARLAKGDPWRIMIYLVIITAVCSAFLDNVTTVLLVGPMTFIICRILKLNPVPYFITQIMASNIGGTATLIGDPPNIMLGSSAGLTFIDFVNYDAPIIVVVLIATIFGFRLFFKKALVADAADMAHIMELDEKDYIKDSTLFKKSVIMIALVVIGFFLHGTIGVESSVIALSAAAIIMLIGKQDIEYVLTTIEWPTIGFFLGLFVVVGGMVHTGVIGLLGNWLMDVSAGNIMVTMLVLLWGSAILSAILDNIPFVATVIPIVLALQGAGMDVTPLWWAISLGACLGGNGTLIGASANVVLSGISTREGYPLTFMQYLKYGVPMMLLSIVICTVYLLIRFAPYF